MKVKVKKVYALSPMQEGMLFHALYEKGSESYIQQGIFTIYGDVDAAILEKSYNLLMGKYEVLSSVFVYKEVSKPMQVVLENVETKLIYKDISAMAEGQSGLYVDEACKEDRIKGFDITKDIPVRLTVMRTGEKSYKLIWTYHHIIMDGWCLAIVLNDLLNIYKSLRAGKPVRLETAEPFSSYIKWLQRQDKEAGLKYWKDYLKGYESEAVFFKAALTGKTNQYRKAESLLKLDSGTTDKITGIAHTFRSTVNNVLQTVWGILLQRYSSSDDVVFGSVVSGRPSEIVGIENMVGLFINTVPVRIKQSKDQRFSELLEEVHKNSALSKSFEFLSLTEIQSINPQRQNLIDHIFVFENYPIKEKIAESGDENNLGFRIDDVKYIEQSHYDLNITVFPGECLSIDFSYNSNVYDAGLIEGITRSFKTIIDQIVESPNLEVAKIRLLSREEEYKLLKTFNDTGVEYPKNKTIHELFEEKAEKVPGNIAVVYEDKHMTYQELNERANQLARVLRLKGVGPDRIAGIMAERSLDMIVGIMGILKAGGAYLPIDPEYPKDRIEYMLEDSGAGILLTQKQLRERTAYWGEIIELDEESIYAGDDSDLEAITKSNDLAYVIYTSGSTGKPKGVMIEHRSAVNILIALEQKYPLLKQDAFLLKTAYTFDVSAVELFGWFFGEGKLVILDKNKEKDPAEILNTVDYYNITHINFVPSMLKLLVNEIDDSNIKQLNKLKYIFVAGEAFDRHLAEKIKDLVIGIKVENIYGPTENTIYTTKYSLEDKFDRLNVSIGKPLSNIRIYILSNNKLQPVGVAGELCIGGDGLARGYLNRSSLTAEKFVENPFEQGTRMYRTGDLARWLPDGNIEFLGRIDYQVKIRGFRIELGEVENQLLEHPNIKEAVVTAREEESGSKYLCAYIVVEKELTVGELREYLAETLPDYMIPSYFVQLNKLPFTANGKIDRKALPEPGGRIETGAEYQAARNEVEEKLVKVWQEILKVERVGINDNFFELGGHSLRATGLAGRIHKELNIEVPLREIFKTPTIKGLSQYIKGQEENKYALIEPVVERKWYELSSAQKRLYTLQQFEPKSTAYNMPGVLAVEGLLEADRLKEAFIKLIERHEALRTSFELVEEEIVQIVHKKAEFGMECLEAREDEAEDKIKEFVRAFDLGKAPLLRAGLIKLHPEKHILMYDMHHIISDGTSMEILVEEFVKLYEGKKLPGLRIQYKDYAAWQNRLLGSEEMRKQEEYWLRQYEGEIPVLNLPTDYPRPEVQSFEGDSISFQLDEKTTAGLRKIGRATGATMYMVILAAFNILLSKYSGQQDIVVGSPIAGRHHADLENIIGMFVNTLAIRNCPEGRKTIREFIGEVKRNALRAYENQDYQYEELVEKLKVRRDMSRNPLFDVMLVLQNTENISVDIAGLSFSGHEKECKVSKFDMTVNAAEIGEKIVISLEYCTRLFKKETAAGIARHLKNILSNVSIDIDRKISEIDLPDEEEKRKVLYEFNNTYAEYPRDKTIQELFEAQAERTPDNIAAVYEDSYITYKELNERANRLARVLRKKGVVPDSIVGIMVERSIEMIVGIMAILKAGGAYLPIDPEYPAGRIEYMLEDSGACILLTQKQLVGKTAHYREIIELDNESIYAGDNSNLDVIAKPDDLVYVIYTSGSTGKPKGVMIKNSGLVNYVTWFADKAGLCEGKKSLLLTSYAFDLGYTCIFPSILNGLELHILQKEKCIDSGFVSDYINKREITYIKLTPSMFNNILDNEMQSNALSSLELVILGGEPVNVQDVEKFNMLYPHVKVMNHYGPTESTIGTISHIIDFSSFKQYKSMPVIGKPINNACIYVIDKYIKLAPIGIPGELCIAGDGLARGYLKRPELTAEKFVENPFEPGKRMYKTGDLARWLPDGNIEFLGRIDDQVKIRGYRIELGEIESRLLSHEAVKEAVVTAKEEQSGNKYLCAYITADKELKVSELRGHLAKKLPDYMIPSYFIQLGKIPLTPNGKIDRRALPEPDGSIETGTEYEAPGNEIEEKLVKIWQEVLGLEKIGINDNFFELGGHSLKATSMAAKVHKKLNAEVPLREIFKTPTVKGLAEYIKGQAKNIYKSIEPVEEKEYYELSSAQKRLYTLQQFDLESTGYNMPEVLEIDGQLDLERLVNAFRKLIERHEALRTSFELIGDNIVQKIHKKVEFKIEHKEAGEEAVEEIVRSFIRPFDLSKAPLLRVGHIKLCPEKNILIFDMHHIISDGVSMGILTDEFVKLYGGKELSPLRLQYKDYAAWQNGMINSAVMKKQEEYWLSVFNGEIPKLCLPTDKKRPEIQSFEGDRIYFDLNEEITKGLRKTAKETGATMYMVLLAAFNILLSKYSGQQDIVVGSPAAGRPHTDLEKIIGMFVNTLAMRNYPEGSKTIKEFIEEVKINALRAYENQDYQFEELVGKLDVRRDMSRNPLFDVMLVLQNTEMGAADIEGLRLKEYEGRNMVSKFDITISAVEVKDKVGIGIEYCTKLFNRETIEGIKTHLINILEDIIKNTEKHLYEIEILNEKEKKKLLYEFNDTSAEHTGDMVIHRLFEEQAERTPNSVAVVYEDKKLTYSELNDRANRLARILRKKRVGPDKIVGIMVERSLEMIVGIIGILKAGGAYLPIDPEYPKDRISYMLEDSGADILLTKSQLRENSGFKGEVIELDDEKLYEGEACKIESVNKPDDLAYVIYTSGTTGEPKGVMIEHRGICNSLQWRKQEYKLDENDRVLQLFSYTFDGFLTSCFTSIISGACVVLPREGEAREAGAIKKYIINNRITHFIIIPAMYDILLELLTDGEQNRLRLVTLAGEKLSKDIVIHSKEKLKKVEICNEYGPTENSVVTTIKRNINAGEKITIGKPILNTKIYILDKHNSLQPIGAAGELCISGDGLARGYLKRPELTAEKFVENPFEPGKRMYKTGDLARWLPDGNIEFLGRIDDQVKIRGYRIELGEIESRLLSHEAVKEAVVTAKEEQSGSKYLCAYITADKELKVSELRGHLAKELPDYMIPSYFIQLGKIPVTPNGKIDRRALPEPDGSIETGTEYEAPGNEIEEKLVKIWQEVLGLEKIGINDNFFELGGHSLKATSMAVKVHKKLNAEVPLREIFKTPTVKGLAEYIKGQAKNIYKSIEPVEEKEYYELSSAQKRLYTLQQFDLESTGYNMPEVLEIEGQLDLERLENAFRKLIERHEALRTSFELIGDKIVQRVYEKVEFEIEHEEAGEEAVEEIVRSFIRPFDLSKAPLLRVGLIKMHTEKNILMFDMHHIISDGASMGIMVEEFVKLYEGKELSPLRLQYKDYAAWQNGMINSEVMKKQEEYWLKILGGELPKLCLPTDNKRPSIQSFEGDRIHFELNEEITKGLRKTAKETGATMYMVLLAGFNILLLKYSGQQDIVVGSPIAGRPHVDLENIMGMFVNTLAIRNYPEGSKTIKEFIEEVKTNALRAYENQDYQFEELVEKLNIRRDMSRNPVFDVMFAMQNTYMGETAMEGINIKSYNMENRISKFDITLTAVENVEKIGLSLEYCNKLFNKDTIERMAGHLKNVLREIVYNINKRICEIKILGEEDRHKLLYGFNNTYAEYPRDKAIHRLFEEQADKTPDNIAVIYKERSLTYRELNEKANRLARVLREKGVGPDKIVGIMAERSLELIAGIMGILKAGGAYLPIDPEYPDDRIEYILEDSRTGILFIQKHLRDKTAFKGEVITLDDGQAYVEDSSNLGVVNRSSDLAYVIYTSGSIGKPKGVMVEHKALSNFIGTICDRFDNNFAESDKCLSLTSISFDVSVGEIFLPLTKGCTLVLYSGDRMLDISELGRIIISKGITFAYIPPSILKELSKELQNNAVLVKLQKMLVGVEPIKDYVLREYSIINKGMQIVNGYGPTEATICATMYKYTGDRNAGKNIPIGSPVNNTRIYIIDKANKLLPIGVTGELCISGDGLARGYLKKPELTAEKFVENPFEPGTRMYKTGDLARWLPDGNIEFLGRTDDQVKIRGYRIELGEIESRLLYHEAVKEAAAAAKEDKGGNKYLCAYVVTDKELTVSELREHLAKELPDYMIPSCFIQIGKIPLTPNGKIDRKALPEPDSCIKGGTEYKAPGNEIEEKLVKIWQEVLGAEKIGTNDNFFELGGHSIKAASMTARIHKELNVEVPLREVFKTSTVKGLAEYIKGQGESIYAAIEKLEEKEYYVLSSAQKRLYTLQQFDLESTGYNMPGVVELEGRLDSEQLENALRKLIERHEALRTSFELIGDEIVQKIHKEVEFEIGYKEAGEEEAEEILRSFVQPFDLSKAPLFKAGLIKVNPGKHILMYDMHHIISDGTSMGILVKELMGLYEGKALPELRLQYKDYAAWQNSMLNTGLMKKQEEHWLKVYEKDIPVLNLPVDYPRPSIQSFEGDRIYIEIDEEITKRLRKIAKESGATMYMVLLAGLNILLSRYSGQEDIVIGSPTAGRLHADLENIMGVFINTLAMRNYPKGSKTIKEFIEEVKTNALRAYENEDYQFGELVEKLDVIRDMSRNPLFDVMLTMQNTEIPEIELEGLKLKSHEMKNMTSKFELSVAVQEVKEKLELSIEYCTKLFRKDTIERMGRYFINILNKAAENPDIKLEEIELLGADERQQLLWNFNAIAAEYPRDKTIHELFEEQADKTPDNTALIFEKEWVTYKELNQRANRLARVLRSKGTQRDSKIGLLAERSIDMVVGILGILKAGGAYLPIDPGYPRERIEYMLKDSGCKLLITQEHLKERIRFAGELITVDETLYSGDAENLGHINKPGDVAYVIYTSGTTGKPKGMMIEHRNVVSLMFNNRLPFEFNAEDVWTMFHSFCFDFSVWEMYGALLYGGRLVIIPKATARNPVEYLEVLSCEGVTVLNQTPAAFYRLAEAEKERKDRNLKLKYIIFGGEALKPAMLKDFHKKYEQVKLINMYGITETTVHVTYKEITENEIRTNISNIGRTIPTLKAYIMDRNNRLVPVGVPGELCIGGAGLGRGYINKPELTAEKFIANPYKPGERIYRSGDLVRMLPDGEMEYLGRIDQQVKIRGYRIELGEVESRMLLHENIKEAVVAARDEDSGSKYLCAYITADKELAASELREHLSKSLPDYMIPSYFIQLEKMPLNQNGKIDCKALPEPKESIKTGTEYQAPGNELQENLVAIWQEVLGAEKIGINDSFFELGGHSLKATALLGRISREFGVDVPLSAMFHDPTIKAISGYIEIKQKKTHKTMGENIILLKENYGSSKNMFFIHSGNGGIEEYAYLCTLLKSNINFWGVKSKDSGNLGPWNTSIEELAAWYIKSIKAIQKSGPYLLGGWSTGGIIAFEMARQLECIGEKVEQLIIIDSYLEDCNTVKVHKPFSPGAEIGFIFDNLELNEANIKTLKEKLKKQNNMNAIWKLIIEDMEEAYGKKTILKSIESIGDYNLKNMIPIFEKASLIEAVRYLNTVRTYTNATIAYVPGSKIQARTAFINATESKKTNKKVWESFIDKSAEKENIEGDHFSIFKPPQINKTAELISNILKKLEG